MVTSETTLVPDPTLSARAPDERDSEEVLLRDTAGLTLDETNRASNSMCDESFLKDHSAA